MTRSVLAAFGRSDLCERVEYALQITSVLNPPTLIARQPVSHPRGDSLVMFGTDDVEELGTGKLGMPPGA